MLTIKPESEETKVVHGYLLGSVGPRPIAFASTLDKDGTPNLAPFSFFNAFGANPPIVVFSPARRVRDNTTKHTLENAWENDEVVVNIVSHDIVHQMVLASTEYPKGVNEFKKAGLTELPSERIKPPRVKEAKVQLECKILEVKSLGEKGGAGNLVIAEIVLMHINEDVLDENKRIDPVKLDQMARLGGRWYSRASKGLMEIPNPVGNKNIGVDGLPKAVQNSKVLTGNDLGLLGKITEFPSRSDVEALVNDPNIKTLMQQTDDYGNIDETTLHRFAQKLLQNNEAEKALKVLFLNKSDELSG